MTNAFSDRDLAGLPDAPVSEPFTGEELARDFLAVSAWGTALWQSLALEDFFSAADGAWSPADHLRHLVKSNRPVARALELPRPVLLLRFGFTRRASRSYSALRDTYREALSAGLRAGRFTPSPLPSARQTGAERTRAVEQWSDTLTALRLATRKWSEGALSRLRLPHPGLGLLTVREMLLFTLYHNTHHVVGVATRRRR